MGLPNAQLLNFEVKVAATMISAGSNSKNVENIFHYQRTATVLGATKAAMSTIFQANILAPMLLAFNIRYTNPLISIRWLDDALDAYQGFPVTAVGAIATDSQPTFNAVFMELQTGLRGRSYRGSKHFPAVNESDTTGDILTGAGLARWQAIQTALALPLTDAIGNVWTLTVVSRKAPAQYKVNPTNVIATPVVAVVLDTDVGTMRRRKVKTTH